MTDPSAAPAYLDPRFAHLQKEYDAVVQCNRCGFCETSCPTYVVSGKETYSPRGRNQALRQVLEGKIADAGSASDIFSTCLTCHACTNVCFAEVPVASLMARAKDIVKERKPVRFLERLAFRVLLHQRKILSVFVWVSFLLKRLKIPAFLRKIGLLKLISPELDAAEELLDCAPLSFGAKVPAGSRSSGNGRSGQTLYFSACGIHYLYPEVSRSFVRILCDGSGPLQCPNHSCCGLIPNSAGDVESARALARKNVRELGALDPGRIVVNDDSCAGFMRSYPELLNSDPSAVEFAGRVRNLSEYLVERHQSGSTPGFNPGGVKVTYHDSCQMGNGQKSFDSPRKVLMNLSGISFVEMDESNWCCGGAGSYCLKHPDLAEDVLERKLLNIRQSEAQVVVTQAASCLMHMRHGIRKKGWGDGIRVLHLAEFLSRGGVRSGRG